MNRCSVCDHERRDEIEAQLRAGTSLRLVSRATGISRTRFIGTRRITLCWRSRRRLSAGTGPRESGRDGSRGARRTGSTPSPVTIL